MPSGLLQLLPQAGPDRLQITSEDDGRVIQVQNRKFIYNWRKRNTAYPTFDENYPEFLGYFNKFKMFISDAGLGSLTFNQWEISYVNQIDKGTLWQDPSDWPTILPGLFSAKSLLKRAKFEDLAMELRYEIPPERARMRISANHGRHTETGDAEFLQLQITVRGPILADNPERGLEPGLNLGHRSAVEAFAEISSPEAHAFWGRR